MIDKVQILFGLLLSIWRLHWNKVASIGTSTRENPQRPPIAPISDPENIIRRGRASQRQASRSARGATSSTSRGISPIVSNRTPFKYSSTEASSSQKFISESENLKVGESSSNFACVYPFPGNSTEVDLPPICPHLPPTPTTSSSSKTTAKAITAISP